MDVERIQKINTLALDLLKQGLAGDREEAVVMAEGIYRNRDGDNSNIRETLNKVQRSANTANEVRNSGSSQESELSQDSVRSILEQNTKFLVSKIKEFSEKITALENEVKSLRSQTRSTPSVTSSMPSSSPQILPSNPALRGSASAPSSSSSHPRSGNYNVQDVSIEKFFYMGSK